MGGACTVPSSASPMHTIHTHTALSRDRVSTPQSPELPHPPQKFLVGAPQAGRLHQGGPKAVAVVHAGPEGADAAKGGAAKGDAVRLYRAAVLPLHPGQHLIKDARAVGGNAATGPGLGV